MFIPCRVVKMVLKVVLWSIILGVASNAVDTNMYVANTLPTLCPYMHFCERNATKRLDDKEHIACCDSCSCDDHCVEFENCCPDKNITNLPARSLSCKSTTVKLSLRASHTGDPYYRTVDRCPADERNLTLFDKCRGDNLTDIQDYLWVTDSITGRTFQNHHCARCHGVYETEVWDIRTRCTKALHSNFKSVTDILLKENDCGIINTPPKTIDKMVQKYRCFKTGLLMCTETGTNKTLIDACESQSINYFSSSRKFVYKNVYCFMCSKPLNPVQEVCDRKSGEPKTDSSFSFVLSGRRLREDYTIEPFQCDVEEIFDMRLNQCWKLHCPFGSAPYNGRCEQFISKLNAVSVRADYNLEILSENTNLLDENSSVTCNELGVAVLSKLLKSLGYRKYKCFFFNYKFLMKTENITNQCGDFLFISFVSTTVKCGMDVLRASLSAPVGKQITVRSKETGSVTLLVTLLQEGFDKMTDNGTISIAEFATPHVSTIISLVSLMSCPKVEINRSKIQSFSNNTLKESLLLLFSNATQKNKHNITEVMYVCVDEYFALTSETCATVRLNDLRVYSLTLIITNMLLLPVITP